MAKNKVLINQQVTEICVKISKVMFGYFAIKINGLQCLSWDLVHSWDQNHIENNADKIINYRAFQKLGRPFTSHFAEPTVESLINQRCKWQQHMRWSREGLDPILQIRAAIASNDWDKNWRTVIASS